MNCLPGCGLPVAATFWHDPSCPNAPKPTSPQPPGLTDEEVNALVEVHIDEDVTWESCERLARAAFAAGCAAQRRVDVEIARGFKKIQPATTRSAHVCIEWTAEEIAAAIESSSGERATTQTRYVCNVDGCHYRTTDKSGAAMHNQASGHTLRIVHSQPETGEVKRHAHEDGKDCGCKDA